MWSALTTTALLLLCAGGAEAQDSAVAVPPQLAPWTGWVLHNHPEITCTRSSDGDTRQCVWPGRLQVEASDAGGTFTLSVWLDRPSLVRLPGGSDMWPQEVQGGAGAPLVLRAGGDGYPEVELPRGAHTVRGRFVWSKPPEVLQVPPELGVVQLTLRDAAVEHPRFDAEGRLWLDVGGAASGEADQADSLRVSVYRQIHDGVPIRVVTRLALNVSGKAREVSLGAVLPGESRPVAIRSGLPVQIGGDGGVKVYIKPGTHRVEIDTLITEDVKAITAPELEGEEFDPQEVWVWKPDEALRSVELSGLTSVDPERTSLPADWRGGTTFLAEPGQALSLKQTRRGEAEPAPNSVQLHRTLWLDLDGRGYTVRDQLTGTLNQDWRLNYAADGQLGRVTLRSQNDDLLITTDADSAQSGVELRQANLNLQAELRLEETLGEIAIVGWDHDVQQLSADVHLPPGWMLLGGSGVDQMYGTWLDSWTLFDFFFVLMVSLALGKLCGWHWALLAAIALGLSHGHGDAPYWVWISLLVSLALLRVLPDGWWRRGVFVFRVAALATLVIILAPYCQEQIRYAIHPQVSQAGYFSPAASNMDITLADRNYEQHDEMAKAEEGQAASAPMEQKAMPRKRRGKADKDTWSLDSSNSNGRFQKMAYSSQEVQAQLQQIDPNAVVQTGPGLPNWSWQSWRLSWTGPVRKDHTIRLWLLSPSWNSALSFLRVALLIAMALLLVARQDMTWTRRDEEGGDDDSPAPPSTGAAALLVAALAGASLAVAPGAAQAQEAAPRAELLSELESRLLAESMCGGPCVVIGQADITVQDRTWTMRAEAHVQKDSSWALPGPADPLRLDEVKVDGLPTLQLRRDPGGLTMVRLPAGRHTLEVTGRLVNRNVVTVQFDEETRPRTVTFRSEAWTVDGINDKGVPDSSLQLTRSQPSRPSGPKPEAGAASQELPPWYQVERYLALGMPWQIRTQVRRDDSGRPQLVKLPLVPGEKVISEGFRVEDGQVLVDFPRGVSQVGYVSELPITPDITLTAAEGMPWSETWSVECSRMWRCGFSDLPPTRTIDTDRTYLPTWRPWPGEQLVITVNRPKGVKGQASTVDEVLYTVTPGKRLMQATLNMTVRASQGGWQKVTLPEGAELQQVQINNAARNIRPRDRVVTLPLQPGRQTFMLSWQQPWERSIVERMPPVLIGQSAVNARLTIHRGDARWLLWARGPDWGPAILFWSHLIVLLILATILGQFKALHLKTWEWLLLAIGFSQLPIPALIPVVAWFGVLSWRKMKPQASWWRFDLLQLTLVGLTLICVGVLSAAIRTNLLIDVDMQVRGAQSSNTVLQWYIDQIGPDGALPEASIISLPILVWRLLMLAWALWLVARLLSWVPWGWQAFSHDGLWRSWPRRSKNQPDGGEPQPDPAPAPDAPADAQAPEATRADEAETRARPTTEAEATRPQATASDAASEATPDEDARPDEEGA